MEGFDLKNLDEVYFLLLLGSNTSSSDEVKTMAIQLRKENEKKFPLPGIMKHLDPPMKFQKKQDFCPACNPKNRRKVGHTCARRRKKKLEKNID
jgi:hypothetical protein